MRLIDVDTLEIKTFGDKDVPEYAILSHTWGPDEVSYQEMCMIARMRPMTNTFNEQPTNPAFTNVPNGENTALMLAAVEMLVRGNWSFGAGLPDFSEQALMKRVGYAKIVHSAKESKRLGYQYVWCDTCCIDKSSSAELQESINTMFRWYKEAAVCLVYLNDVEPGDWAVADTQATLDAARDAFSSCRWRYVTRGFTLQELVAPLSVRFYFQDWSFMGEKNKFVEELSTATGIPISVLENGDLNEVSLAERMSWGALRQTTRVEDIAYCLLGIFDIQMPLLYGEGEKAFIRLQEEILKTTDDYSLFAWRTFQSGPKPTTTSTYRGLLARSPLEFHNCGPIERENVTSAYPVTSTPIGLRLQLEFLPNPKDDTRFLAMIRCSNHMNQRLAIYLKRLDGTNQYARVDAGSIIPIDNWPTGQLRTIYVRQKISIPPDFYTTEFRCLHIQRRIAADRSIPPIHITTAFPPENWSASTQQLRIPQKSNDFLGVLFLRSESQSGSYDASMDFQVIVGLDRKTEHYWCKAVVYTWPKMDVDRGRWRAVIRKMLPKGFLDDTVMKSDARHDIFMIGDTGLGVNVTVRAGMLGDNVVLQVMIDGLAKGR